MRIIFIGPPGVGKGTQSLLLVDYLCVPHLSAGDLLRQAVAQQSRIGRAAEAYLADGRLVPDDLVEQLIQDRVARDDCRSGWLLDGFPRTRRQAEFLAGMLAREGKELTAVVELRVDNDEVVRRLLSRGRSDDDPETIRKRLEVYRQQTAPLLDYYREAGLLRSVDGHGTQDEVFGRLRRVVDGCCAAG